MANCSVSVFFLAWCSVWDFVCFWLGVVLENDSSFVCSIFYKCFKSAPFHAFIDVLPHFLLIRSYRFSMEYANACLHVTSFLPLTMPLAMLRPPNRCYWYVKPRYCFVLSLLYAKNTFGMHHYSVFSMLYEGRYGVWHSTIVLVLRTMFYAQTVFHTLLWLVLFEYQIAVCRNLVRSKDS
jgi:hypothetical protein